MATGSRRVLIVEDEPLLNTYLKKLLTRHAFEVDTFIDPEQALEAFSRQPYDLVITDYKMPNLTGEDVLRRVKEMKPDVGVIVITAYGTIQNAVRCIQLGAFDYITKPFPPDALIERIQAFFAQRESAPLEGEGRESRRRRSSRSEYGAVFIGEHPKIVQLRQLARQLAQNDAPVLIQGENGTGKEVLARFIHAHSRRARGPYVAINCANLPRELVESTLFGHKKGAFTGAIEDASGAFEQARGGTLLLDEITEIELPIQAKLLRVLQEREFTRVGSHEPIVADVRVIATTNRDIHEAIARGLFREDLYHRLSVFPIVIPPLRERASDIPVLARHFVQKYTALYNLPEKELASDLVEALLAYDWPGNVRQLENLIHRGVLLSGDRRRIEVEDVFSEYFSDRVLFRAVRRGSEEKTRTLEPVAGDASDEPSASALVSEPDVPLKPLEEVERLLILKALAEANQNQQRAAAMLGISARTIRNKLRQYRQQGLL
jgi:DNA-binding NtrC family response regulator|nr:MAG: sigma-54-dependent Fis family transcriptional regulator [Bacteroidota bacterium]